MGNACVCSSPTSNIETNRIIKNLKKNFYINRNSWRVLNLLLVDTGEACPVSHKSTWLSGRRGSRSSCPTWPLWDWSDWPLDFLLIGHRAYIFPCSSDSDTDSWHTASTKPSYEEIICPYPPTTVWKDFFVHFVLLVSSHQCYWC